MLVQYTHEPFTNFTDKDNEKLMKEALKEVTLELGGHYPLIVNGERITTDEKIVSVNPANREEVIGYVSKATKEIVKQAINVASDTFETWRKTDTNMRADILFRAAAIIRKRKHEFSAHLIKEGGKPWNEADADTAEAIDFLEYYGRQMIKLKEGM